MIAGVCTLVILNPVPRATPEVTVFTASPFHGPAASFAKPDRLATRSVIANAVSLSINGRGATGIANPSLANLAA